MPIIPSRNEVWYHTTPSRHQASIGERGILPGALRKSHPIPGTRIQLTISMSAEELKPLDGGRRLGDRREDYLIYEIRAGCSRLTLRPDPLSVNRTIGSDDGYIVVGTVVPADLLEVIETVLAEGTYPEATKSLNRIAEPGWTVPDPYVQPPPDIRLWRIGGYKGPNIINPELGETRREVCWKAIEQLRQRGLL